MGKIFSTLNIGENLVFDAQLASIEDKWKASFGLYRNWKVRDVEFLMENLGCATEQLKELRGEAANQSDSEDFLSQLVGIRCNWGCFFKAIQVTECERVCAAIDQRKKEYHPSTIGYSIDQDKLAIIEIEEFIANPSIVVQRDPCDFDGYISDEGSSEEGDSASEIQSGNDEVLQNLSTNSKGGCSPGHVEIKSRTLEIIYETVLRPRPECMDASLVSPIFFGYTGKIDESLRKEAGNSKDEETEDELACKRVREREARLKKLYESRGENDIIEITALERNIEREKLYEKCSFPAGDEMERVARIDLEECSKKLEEKNKLLSDAFENMIALKDELKHTKNYSEAAKLRSMIIVVESKVEQGERHVTRALEVIQEQKVLLQRALRRKRKENAAATVFVPLCYGDNGDCACLLDIVMSLLILCNDEVCRKCKFACNLLDLNNDGFISKSEISALLSCFSTTGKVTTIGSVFEIEEIESATLRIFQESCTNGTHGLTHFELDCWIRHNISSNRLLSALFHTTWKYQRISDYQLRLMNPLRKYEIGLISKSQLNHTFASSNLTFRPLLSSNSKEKIHKLAIARGIGDPLKMDYTCLLPKKNRGTGFGSVAVPLEHGHLTNMFTRRCQVETEAAMYIQRWIRGLQVRKRVRAFLKGQAFFMTADVTLRKAREAVLAKFDVANSSGTAEKLKWNAAVRVKQAKLKANGLNLTRGEVIDRIIREEVESVTGPIIEIFRNSADEGGLKNEFETFVNSNGSHVPDFVAAYVCDGRSNQANRVLHPLIENVKPELPTAHLLLCIQSFDGSLTQLKAQSFILALPSKRLICTYACSFGDIAALSADIAIKFGFNSHLSDNIARKLKELVTLDMERGVVDQLHEKILEKNVFVLKSMRERDYEDVIKMANDRIRQKSQQAAGESLGAIEKIDIICRSDSEFIEKEEMEAEKMWNNIAKQRRQYDLKMYRLEQSKRCLNYMRRLREQTSNENVDLENGRLERENWTARFFHAMAAPETDEYLVEAKYNEIQNVTNEFLAAAKAISRTIIEEMHLPVHLKTIVPRERGHPDASGTRSQTYEARGIIFKLLVDNHGIFNGSDEYCAKTGGHAVRGSREYLKLCDYTASKVIIPVQTVVDWFGFRMLATAKLPLVSHTFEGTDMHQVNASFVMGTIDGQHVFNKSRDLDLEVERLSSKLNLAKHYVKGESDIGARSMHTSADVRGYENIDGKFYLMNFWRSFPSEHPNCTQHLQSSPRGMSIFWRMLRPELVVKFCRPLSPNANSQISANLVDTISHQKSNADATNFLLRNNISSFADKIANMKLECDRFGGLGIDISLMMHRAGINMRHLGLLRSHFWRKISGGAEVKFGSNKVVTRGSFLAQGVRRGSQLKIGGDYYRVSTDTNKELSSSVLHLGTSFDGNSSLCTEVFAGEVSNEANSESVRALLLAEIVARTLKNIVRQHLRSLYLREKFSSEQLMQAILVDHLNTLTGSNSNTEEMWTEHVYLGLCERFGDCILSKAERFSLFDRTREMLVYMVNRLTLMMGIEIKNRTLKSFSHYPTFYRFVVSDIKCVKPMTKHNIHSAEFSGAMILSARSKLMNATSYEYEVKRDNPLVYWQLSDNKASSYAHNKGSLGKNMAGKYSGKEELEVVLKGNMFTAIKTGARFEPENLCSVTSTFPENSIKDMETNLSVEIWVEVNGSTGCNRIAATLANNFVLAASRREVWIFVAHVLGKVLLVLGPPITYGKLQHIIGTYDDEKVSLYVDGYLAGIAYLREECVDKRIKEEMGDMAGCFFGEDRCDDNSNLNYYGTGQKILSVGGASRTRKAKGSSFFNGNLAHFSVYAQCLHADAIRRHFCTSQQIHRTESARLSSEAKSMFERAIDIAPSDEKFIKGYCDHLCCSIENDDKLQSDDAFQRARKAISYLEGINHLDGLAQLLRVLPSKKTYADMVCGLYNFIVLRNPSFFYRTPYLPLSELAMIPFRFSLVNTNDTAKIGVAAGIFRHVLGDRNISSVYGSDLHWIPHIENDAVVVSLVSEVFYGKLDSIDLTLFDNCSTLNDCDLVILGKSCAKVRSFTASDCKNISNEALGFALGKWSLYLQNLALSKLSISGATFSSLQCCPNMMVLRLEACDHVDNQVLLSIIQSCPKLKEVYVNRCPLVSDAFLCSAGKSLAFLESLSVSWSSISDFGLKSFCESSASSRLKYLDISHCDNLSDDGVKEIAACTKLSYINLNGLDVCNDSSVGSILRSCKNVGTMNLENTNLTNQCFDGLSLPVLKNVNISGCFNISDLSWLRKSNKLERLTSCGVNLLTSEGVNNCLVNMKCLKSINFASCHLFTDRLLTNALSFNSSLKISLVEIDLSGCIRLTDAGVKNLTENFRNIVSLSMARCRRITDNSTNYITNNLFMLKTLNLKGCKGISKSALKRLLELLRGISLQV